MPTEGTSDASFLARSTANGPGHPSSPSTLPRRPLGKTGLELSVIGLGTVKLGRNQDVKYPRAFEIPGDEQARELLDAAWNLGINVLDTAPAYGNSEERLGGLLAGQRDRWLIVTKAGEEFEAGHSRFDFSPAQVRASLERSLSRLRADRVDVLLIHSDGIIEQAMPDELWKELYRLRSAGKVRAVGVSTKTVDGAMACMPHADVLMVTLNPEANADLPVIAAARDMGVGILVKKALSSGHSSDPSAALSMVLGTPGVTSAIVGTINPAHLAANCRLPGL